MCIMCQGATEDELLSRIQGQIRNYGLGIIAVGDNDEDRGWAYTIGLVEGMDHPELIVAGYRLWQAMEVLDDLGSLVVFGQRLDLGTGTIGYRGVPLGAVPVLAQQLEGDLMSAWRWYYDSMGRPELHPRALQIVLPDGGFCHEHQTRQPRLDRVEHVSLGGGTRQLVRTRSPRPRHRRRRR
jgi:hypothetical protein